MGQSVRVLFDTLRRASAASTEFNGTFAVVNQIDNTGAKVLGTSAFQHNARILQAYNNTNNDAYISFDKGATIHGIVPANGTWVFDFTANKSTSGGDFMFEKTDEIYIRTVSGAASTGTAIYFTIIYGKGE